MQINGAKLKVGLAAIALVLGGASLAQAHTTSIGFVSAGTPGSVTFWTGSYHHGGTPNNEGTLTLNQTSGGSFSGTFAFNIGPTARFAKPAGLIDGTTNFYWLSNGVLDQSLTSDPGTFGGVEWWQGVTVSGLTAGDYTFGCGTTCGTTAQWASLGSGTGQFTLTDAIINPNPPTGGPIPEPSTIFLFGSGLVGLAAWRMRKNQPIA